MELSRKWSAFRKKKRPNCLTKVFRFAGMDNISHAGLLAKECRSRPAGLGVSRPPHISFELAAVWVRFVCMCEVRSRRG